MNLYRCSLYFAVLLFCASQATAIEQPRDRSAADNKWEQGPYGLMLRRVLPPGPDPKELPEPDSAGAQALTRYCVQCHNLPSPYMHTPERWRVVVERMDRRMHGEGNLGTLMKELMEGVKAPSQQELDSLLAYLGKHGQKAIDPGQYPDLKTTVAGQSYSEACVQCHELPDPKRHTAKEWPLVVERMQKNMAWVGVIKGNVRNPHELKVEDILDFLERHGRDN
ncbi:MAG TPA: hypothetical protein VK460_02535 [Burkholderiales bacterium]|nr:hypothetical protein [Burkholderiales bacterium]